MAQITAIKTVTIVRVEFDDGSFEVAEQHEGDSVESYKDAIAMMGQGTQAVLNSLFLKSTQATNAARQDAEANAPDEPDSEPGDEASDGSEA